MSIGRSVVLSPRRARALALVAGLAASAAFTPAALAQSSVWGLSAGGTWDTTTSNWLTNNTPPLTTFVAGNEAIFGGTLFASRTVGVASGGVSAGGITFNALGTSFYSVGTTGNTITLNSGGTNDLITVGSGVLGAATFTGTGGQTLTGSPLSFTNNLLVTNNGTFGLTNLTISSAINRATAGGTITFAGQGNTSVTGAIGSNVTGGLVKNGSGTVNLSNISNAFTGGITVNSGVLAIATSNDGAFGNTANGVTLNAGGTLRFGLAVTLASARVFTVNGSAASPSGIDLGTSAIQNFGAGQLVGSGALRLTYTNATSGTLGIAGANAGFTGTVQVGSNPIVLVGSVPTQRLFSSSNVNAMTLNLNTSGTLANAAGIVVNNQSALTITQPATAVTGRLGTVPLTFNNARFQYTPSSTAAITDTFGAVTANGLWTISGGAAAGNAAGTTITFAGLTRNDNATLSLRAPTTGTGSVGGAASTGQRIFITGLTPDTTTSGTTRSVIPWAGSIDSVTGTDHRNFVTYDANGLRPLASTELASLSAANTLAAAATGVNVLVTSGSQAIKVGGQTVNALATSTAYTLSGTATASSPGDVLTVSSGAFANFNTLTVDNATIDTGGNTAYFHLGFPTVFQTNSRLTTSGGVVASSYAGSSNFQLRFTNTPTGGNTFTGGLYANGNAGIAFTLNNQLGNDGSGNAAGEVVLSGGQLLFSPSAAGTVSLNDGANNRPIRVTAPGGTIGTSVAGAVLQIPGTISGAGQVQFGGGGSSNSTGVVELTGGANTYTGGTLVSAGILRISNPNQLGTGAVFLTGGTLQAAGSLTFSNAPTIINSSTLDTQGNNITLASGLAGSGGATGTTGNSITLTKAGTGTLNLQGTTSFAGTIAVGPLGGTVSVAGSASIPSLAAINISRSGTFSVDDSTTSVPNRLGASANVTLANGGTAGGATLNLTTNAAGSSFSFGSLTLAGGVSGNVNSSVINLIDGGSGNNTITFTSLSGLSTNNLLSFVGTTNFGRTDIPGGTRVFITGQAAGPIANLTLTGFGGTGQAFYDLARGLRLLDLNLDFLNGPALQNAAPTSTATTASFRVNPSVAAVIPIYDAANTINLLRLAPGGQLDYTVGATNPTAGVNPAASTLTITSGTILSEAGVGGSITSTGNNALTITSGATNLGIQTDSPLSLGAAIGGTGGLTKSGNAALSLNGGGSNTGALTINAGSVSIGAATSFGSVSSSTGTNLVLNAPLTLTGTTVSSVAGTLSGTGSINYNPTSATTLTLIGNNTGYSGNITGNANARFAVQAANALGSGTLTIANATSATVVSFAAGNATIANNINLSSTGGITSTITNGAAVNQTTTLGGKISGGSSTAGTVMQFSGPADDSSTFVLANPNNDFTATIEVDEGVLAITSNAALGNPVNGLSLFSATTSRGGLRFDANNIALGATRNVNFRNSNVIDTQAFNASIDGVISTASTTAVFTKAGSGTLAITNPANTFNSNVTVAAGTLLVNGNLPGATTANTLTVAAGATLGGSGTIGTSTSALRNITVNGVLSPGNSPGVLTSFGNLSLNAGSSFLAELAGPAVGTGYDQMVVNGTVTLATTGAGVTLNAALSYLPAPTLADVYWVLVNDGADAITGTFAGAPEGSIVSIGSFNGVPYTAQISYLGSYDALNPTVLGIGSGNDIVLYNIVPAPGAAGLLGMAGLLAARRRRR